MDQPAEQPDLTTSRFKSWRSVPRLREGGSLTRRMIGIASLWIAILLVIGGLALDRVLTQAIVRNFDAQLEYALTAMIASAEIGPDGEVRFIRPLGDQRFLEPYSGFYWQITLPGHDPLPSRSLWDRRLPLGADHRDHDLHRYDSNAFDDEPLRIIERDARLPDAEQPARFQVASSREGIESQIAALRRTLVRSFAMLALGLIGMAALQATFGLWPLRRVREAIADVRAGRESRVDETLPREIEPLVAELNDLLAHNERQAEEARRHAGNLAHALKTPLTVLQNEAAAQSEDLPATVMREIRVMRRQVDHQLARARAIGRRGAGHSRTAVWASLTAVERAVTRLHAEACIDITGNRGAEVQVERQDLDEMLGNLIENAAKYGGGRVFVTVARGGGFVEIAIEDDGPGIPAAERETIFGRGARLDTEKPGTGLGLGIVRDVAQIYGGTVSLDESEDLGGLLVRLRLPAAS